MKTAKKMGFLKFWRWLFTCKCPTKDCDGHLNTSHLDPKTDRLIYECDTCKTEFI